MMTALSKDKKVFFIIIVLVAILDLVLVASWLSERAEAEGKAINKNIDHYVPVYTSTPSRNLVYLHANYYFQVALRKGEDLTREPRAISDAECLGYANKSTGVMVVCEIMDPQHQAEPFEHIFSITELKVGERIIQHPVPGFFLRNSEVLVKLNIEKRKLPIRVKKARWYWTSYENEEVYYLTMEVKRIKIVTVRKS